MRRKSDSEGGEETNPSCQRLTWDTEREPLVSSPIRVDIGLSADMEMSCSSCRESARADRLAVAGRKAARDANGSAAPKL